MRTWFQTTVLILSCGLFAACAGLVESEVTVFHRLSQPSIPTKYLFYEMEDQRKSLEYKTYQDLIRTELAKHQYTETPSLSDADVIVAFNYGIDSGREKLESIPSSDRPGSPRAIPRGRPPCPESVRDILGLQPAHRDTGSSDR